MLLERLLRLQEELDTLFTRPGADPMVYGNRAYPPVNWFEREDAHVLTTELPGFAKQDVKVEVKGNVLNITGKRNSGIEEGYGFHRRERGYGTFSRQLNLPREVDAESIKASLQDGVLTIQFEKLAQARTKQITIA
ncbi:MAG: hypothetical protein A2284_17475 [Deltaproteobacteria bacterium RIFOXYA12_FULL_61_11]|nr:MAG: hypothetical protein A2284_17475 [Deltaproteobacteria bacterium RIFOXYA12_FULL_61_11]